MEISPVDLGFAEECESWLLRNRYFPSKIGGKPAWLELNNLPKPENLRCDICQDPMVFLCQIYAPIETNPECFHRTIFLFICTCKDCFQPNSSRNIKAFRCQIKQENNYYPATAPDLDNELPAIAPLSELCNVCGCLGPLKCANCKSAFYCGKSHQKIDWMNGHKKLCKDPSTANLKEVSRLLFPEFEIVIEPEPTVSTTSSEEDDDETEKRRLEEYENLVKGNNTGKLCNVPESELEQYATCDDDKFFRKFKKVIASNPEQVIRYQRGGEPLPITDPSLKLEPIPCCEICGSNRIFEFQIMPQLLNYLENDIIDWGTILVYACNNSCDTKHEYVKEFIVKQDIDEKKDAINN